MGDFDRPEKTSASRPTELLSGGVALAVIGAIVFSFGFAAGIGYMDTPGGAPAILAIPFLGGLLATVAGVIMVVVSFGWWLWRLARWVLQVSRD